MWSRVLSLKGFECPRWEIPWMGLNGGMDHAQEALHSVVHARLERWMTCCFALWLCVPSSHIPAGCISVPLYARDIWQATRNSLSAADLIEPWLTFAEWMPLCHGSTHACSTKASCFQCTYRAFVWRWRASNTLTHYDSHYDSLWSVYDQSMINYWSVTECDCWQVWGEYAQSRNYTTVAQRGRWSREGMLPKILPRRITLTLYISCASKAALLSSAVPLQKVIISWSCYAEDFVYKTPMGLLIICIDARLQGGNDLTNIERLNKNWTAGCWDFRSLLAELMQLLACWDSRFETTVLLREGRKTNNIYHDIP